MVSPKNRAACKKWIAERRAERSTIVVSAFGAQWELSEGMPARLRFWVQSRPDPEHPFADLTLGQIDELAQMVIPEEMHADWLTLAGLEIDDFRAAVVDVVVRYLYPAKKANNSGGAAESTSQTSSSETSGSSTPTSPANTPTDTPEDSGPSSKPD